MADGIDLLSVVKALQPSVLIGTSGQADAFSEAIVRAMASGCDQPAIFPFSNPTSKCEATPENILRWTEGRALVATGSPFAPVEVNGSRINIGQSNNVYVFPGVGLGCLVAEAREVTDSMFTIAAEAVANTVSEEFLQSGTLFPPLSELRDITHKIAVAVVKETNRLDLGNNISDDGISEAVKAMMWFPDYPEVEAV